MFSYRLEAAKDDYRIRCEELEKEITELRQQNEELTNLADEAQSLKDEMDVLRYRLFRSMSFVAVRIAAVHSQTVL